MKLSQAGVKPSERLIAKLQLDKEIADPDTKTKRERRMKRRCPLPRGSNLMQRQWPQELTAVLSEMIGVYIAQYNADHDAESNISQEQKMELKDALAAVFGQPAFPLEFTSKPN